MTAVSPQITDNNPTMETSEKDGDSKVNQACKEEDSSHIFYTHMKQRGSRVRNLKPLRHYTEAPLYEAFWPFFMGMKLFGLFHSKEYTDTWKYGCEHDKSECPPLRKRVTPSSVYSFTVMFILWANVARYCTIFQSVDGFGPILFQKIVTISFFSLTAVNATACFLACHKYSNIPEFFYEWARLHQEYPGIWYCGKIARKLALGLTVLVWLAILTTMGLSVYSFFYTDVFSGEEMLTPFTGNESYASTLEICVQILMFFVFGACYYPLCLAYVMCLLLTIEFKSFREDFKNFVKDTKKLDADSFQCKFETMRRRHQHICTLVGHVDDFLSLYNGAVFVLCMVNLTLLLYLLIWESDLYEGNEVVLGMMYYWLIESTVTLLVVLIGAARANDMAHAPFEQIHDIKFDPKVNTQLFHIQLTLFLARLTGSPIGLTSLNLFVIDKPAILTIFGMFITYFVILVQFRPGLTSSNDAAQQALCNSTNFV